MRRIFNLEPDRRFERLSLGTSVHVEGRRCSDPADKVRLGGYAILDLRSEYRLNDERRLQGRIVNLFSTDCETVYGYNQLGQVVHLSVRYQALWGRVFWMNETTVRPHRRKERSTMNESLGKNQRHRERMEHKKAVVDEKTTQARDERGVSPVHSGNGKGKSSSAFGMVARALGHSMKVSVVRFIRGAASTGEEALPRRFPEEVSYHVMGEGFTWETQDRQHGITKAEAVWKVAAQLLVGPDAGLVMLGELNIALKHGYLELNRALTDIQVRPAMQHVMVTGRGA